jgi:hypothetical protein
MTGLVICGLIFDQNHTKDESPINGRVDAMIYSRNNNNYNDLKTSNTGYPLGEWCEYVVERTQGVTKEDCH